MFLAFFLVDAEDADPNEIPMKDSRPAHPPLRKHAPRIAWRSTLCDATVRRFLFLRVACETKRVSYAKTHHKVMRYSGTENDCASFQ